MALLVCVGGTGQHVALAVSRLVNLGAIEDGIECCIVDADNRSKLAKRTKNAAGYVDHNFGIDHPLGDSARGFLTPFDPEAAADGGSELTVRDLTLGQTPKPETANLFDALFRPEDAEQNIHQGFYAKPKLGSTAFAAQSIKGDGLVSQINAKIGNHDKVFICGSFIGGTGAGVIPSLVQKLTRNSAVKWYGMFHLRWLDPTGGGNAAITGADMDRNMRHGAEYFYQYVRENMRASVLMGPPTSGTDNLIGPVSNPANGENPSFYHVLASYALHHFRTDAVEDYDGSVGVFNHDDANRDWLLEQEWHGQKSLVDRLQTAAYAAELLEESVSDNFQEILRGAYGAFGTKSKVPDGLRESIADYADDMGVSGWTGGMKDEAGPELFQPLRANLEHRRQSLEERLDYFRDVFGNFERPTVGEPRTELRDKWGEEHKVALPSSEGVDRVNHLADKLTKLLLN